jgi:hypothetical protein
MAAVMVVVVAAEEPLRGSLFGEVSGERSCLFVD